MPIKTTLYDETLNFSWVSKVNFFPILNGFEYTTLLILEKCLFFDVLSVSEKGHIFWRFLLIYPEKAHFLPSADSKAVCRRLRKHFLTPPPDIIESQL
jgi:hypothetical protein